MQQFHHRGDFTIEMSLFSPSSSTPSKKCQITSVVSEVWPPKDTRSCYLEFKCYFTWKKKSFQKWLRTTLNYLRGSVTSILLKERKTQHRGQGWHADGGRAGTHKPSTQQQPREAGGRSPRGTAGCQVSDSSSRTERINFCCFKLLHLL